MLKAVLTEARASGLHVAAMAQELGIPRSRCRSWLEGKTVPAPHRADEFMAVVRKLGHSCGRAKYTDAEWKSALRAAQQEAQRTRGRQDASKRREHHPDLPFVGLHGLALGAATADVRGRTSERSVMNSFVRDSTDGAPSYLCWCADTPVGKTTLLADYLRRHLPAGTDVLSFFVSPAHGTDTRATFEQELTRQIGQLLGRPGASMPIPRSVPEWKRLFTEAAARSTRHGRRLLLVVDGLDDDVAWSGLAAESGGRSGGQAGTRQKLARGSIAAFLPSPPPPGMRVIVSLRRSVRLPDDVPPVRHPLRTSWHLRTLTPVAGVPLIRQPPPDPTALGEPVVGLLAVAGGGLRIADLAELTGTPTAYLDRLAQGPAGRALVNEDPVSRTYALADSRLEREIRAELGEAAVLRRTQELLAWSRRWHAAGWPEGTPPYPLACQLRLLTAADDRATYILDLSRLRRLARTDGPPAAFTQLEAFEAEISGAGDVTSDALATLVPLSAARALLRAEAREVPYGAASLFARLGDVERARALARSAPTAIVRAVHLADVAAEMAHASEVYEGAGDAPDTLVREAVEWLAADRNFPGTARDSEAYVRILAAARALATRNNPAARPLLHAVLQDQRAGTETLIAAAGLVEPLQEPDLVAVLRDRAETLSEGGLRARTVAVDVWGALARAAPTFGPEAGDRIEEICAELGDGNGLGEVDVLATAASTLLALPAGRPRSGATLMREALARMHEVVEPLRDPDFLPDENAQHDGAHLGRELSGTLHRLAKAVHAAGHLPDREALARLMSTVSERLRIEVCADLVQERGQEDSVLERAQLAVYVAQIGRKQRDSDAEAAVAEKRKEKRRADDAKRAKWAEERARWAEEKAQREKRGSSRTGVRTGRTLPQARQSAQAQAVSPEPDAARQEDRRELAPRARPAPRRAFGLSLPGDDRQPDFPHSVQPPPPPHLPLLLESDDQLTAGNFSRSRELLEAALRASPLVRQQSTAHVEWTSDLCQAMAEAGRSDEAEEFVAQLSGAQVRARHLAALSRGCFLSGQDDEGARHARAAARLMSDGADSGPVTAGPANAVAQALAYAGDEAAARAMVTGANAAQRRQALMAVAAGLVRHCPEGAARIAIPLVEAFARRIDAAATQGSPRVPLPELAALLLAFPDVRHPDPRLSDALHRAALHVADPSKPRATQSMVVLTLLARLGCLSDEAAYAVEASISTDGWRRALQPGQQEEFPAELALLATMAGDTAAVSGHAEAARTPDARSMALRTAAAHLAGIQVPLATDSRADDRVVRTCLALARTSGVGSPQGEAMARHFALRLLRSDAWAGTIPLIPALAPGALGHLRAIASDMSRDTGGSVDAEDDSLPAIDAIQE